VSDDVGVVRRAQAWAEDGLDVALATVVSTWGSAPRPAGSLLAATARGEFEGSVSGGCVEGAVIREARAAIADGRPRLVEYGVSDAQAREVGLACGGAIRVFVQQLAGAAVLPPLLARAAARAPVVAALDLTRGALAVLDPAAPAAAAPSLGSAAEGAPADVAAAARDAADRDAPTLLDRPGGAWFLRPFVPPVRVVVFGAVHIAQALAPMIRLAGWEAVVVDPRRAFATPARFEGVRLEHGWPDEALPRIGLDRRTAVVTLTHDPKLDDPALAAALRSEAFYVGALGSRRSQAARRERLRDLGVPDAARGRLHGPVGLAIGARSPAEIAVSIVAEIVSVLRAAAPAAPRDPAGDRSPVR
jgi:xanthine dehydrogenase accessory factor